MLQPVLSQLGHLLYLDMTVYLVCLIRRAHLDLWKMLRLSKENHEASLSITDCRRRLLHLYGDREVTLSRPPVGIITQQKTLILASLADGSSIPVLACFIPTALLIHTYSVFAGRHMLTNV
jgi:hypothetical protein